MKTIKKINYILLSLFLTGTAIFTGLFCLQISQVNADTDWTSFDYSSVDYEHLTYTNEVILTGSSTLTPTDDTTLNIIPGVVYKVIFPSGANNALCNISCSSGNSALYVSNTNDILFGPFPINGGYTPPESDYYIYHCSLSSGFVYVSFNTDIYSFIDGPETSILSCDIPVIPNTPPATVNFSLRSEIDGMKIILGVVSLVSLIAVGAIIFSKFNKKRRFK